MTSQNLDSELSKLRIDKAKKRPPQRGLGGLFWLLLLLAVGGGGLFYYKKVNAAVPVKLVRAEVEKEEREGIAILTTGGYVIPRKKIEVSSKIVGQVDQIYVDRGDKVKSGDVLIRIEDSEYRAQVRMAEATLASARARLAELKAGSRPEEVEAAHASVASAEATFKGAKLDLDRLESLGKEEVISRQELDRIRTSYSVAQANLKSARKNAELVELGPRKEQIDAAAAQAHQAEANLAYAKTQLAYTVIRAPITGTILEKLAEKGELVTNINFGGTRGAKSSVVSMANLADLQVEIDLNENDLSKVRLGQTCEIRLDSLPGHVFTGKVDEIAPEADRQKATVQVKVRIENPQELVRPEVNARVTFLAEDQNKDPKGAAEPKVWIPRSALAKGEDGGSIVYIANGGTAVARPVKLGSEGEKGIQVTGGLSGSEMLIDNPQDQKIADGTRIEVTT